MSLRFFRGLPNMSAGRIIPPLLGVLLFLCGIGVAEFPFADQSGSATGYLYAQSEQEQYQTAYNLYTQAAALPANSPQKTQAWNSVIDAFTRFISQYPNSAKRNESELFLGYAYLMRSGYIDVRDGEAGRSHLYYIIQQGKNSKNEDIYRKALLQYAYSYFSLLDYRNAQPNLQKFIAEFPNSDDLQYAYYYAGVTEANLGNYIKAQEYFQACLTKFPNGARRDLCLLEKAAADGRAGNYEQADQELYRLSMDANYPYRQKAELQRTYLKVLQDDFNGAIQILDQFIQTNGSNSANNDAVKEALGYEAFCYLCLDRYNDGLNAIARIEQMESSLTPQVAYLKIQLLTKLGRFSEAGALLRQIQSSVMSLANSDLIPYYDSTIRLGEGNYDAAINEVLRFAAISPNPTNKNQYEIHYFDQQFNSSTAGKLSPLDYLNACGNLVLSYASRYAKTRNASDNANQEAVFQAMYQYASKQTDPALMKIVQHIDRERKDAAVNPIGAAYVNGAVQQNPNVNLAGTVPNLNQNTPSTNLNMSGSYPANPAIQPSTGNPLQPASGTDAQFNPNTIPPANQVVQNNQPNAAQPVDKPEPEAKESENPALTQKEAEAMLKKALDAHSENRNYKVKDNGVNLYGNHQR